MNGIISAMPRSMLQIQTERLTSYLKRTCKCIPCHGFFRFVFHASYGHFYFFYGSCDRPYILGLQEKKKRDGIKKVGWYARKPCKKITSEYKHVSSSERGIASQPLWQRLGWLSSYFEVCMRSCLSG